MADDKEALRDSSRKDSFVVQRDWQSTAEARALVNAMLGKNKRKVFGLLEKPQFERGGKMYPMLSRRLFLVGRSGVGKTSTVHKLMGRDIPLLYKETLGIQTSTLYWPVMLECVHRLVIVKLELWDVGERMLSRYDHILPTCKQSTDGILFFFSYTDRHSWESLPQLFTSTLGSLPTPDAFNMVIGTHADCSNREVSVRELEQFQRQYKIIALPASNVNSRRHAVDHSDPDGRAGVEDITVLMNDIVEVLLAFEKRKVSLSGLAKEAGLSSLDYILSTLPPYS